MTAPDGSALILNPRKRIPLLALSPALRTLMSTAGVPYEVAQDVGWEELEEELRLAPPSAVVVLDPYAGEPYGALFPRIRDLLRRFPSVPVVAAVELRPELTGDLQTLLEWGVSEVLSLGPESTPRALRARLRQAHARPFKRAMEAALSQYVGAEARVVLRAAAEVAVENGQAPDLARRLGVTTRTLTSRCPRVDLPAPRQTQAWMRVLLACMLLDDPGRTVYSAAYASGYSTERSLRRAITSFLGVDSTALRRAGAFVTAAAAFNDRLREVRELGRERRRLRRARAELQTVAPGE
ncbi:AraC family transcriptional regulator [Longimicrobium terrae]|nr:helix-turn-helix domain-containing protein [Longimicrobium terrae]